MYELREKYNLSQPNLQAVVSGKRNVHLGWSIGKSQGASSRKS